MKQTKCRRENEVTNAARMGRLSETLAAHVAECAGCSEAMQAARWMRSLAAFDLAAEAPPTPLPDPAQVWRRSALADTQAKSERIRTSLEYAQVAFAAAAPIGIASWVVWNWYAIETVAAQILLATWPQLAAATFALASLAPAALTVMALSLGYPLLAGE